MARTSSPYAFSLTSILSILTTTYDATRVNVSIMAIAVMHGQMFLKVDMMSTGKMTSPCCVVNGATSTFGLRRAPALSAKTDDGDSQLR